MEVPAENSLRQKVIDKQFKVGSENICFKNWQDPTPLEITTTFILINLKKKIIKFKIYNLYKCGKQMFRKQIKKLIYF